MQTSRLREITSVAEGLVAALKRTEEIIAASNSLALMQLVPLPDPAVFAAQIKEANSARYIV